MLFFYYIPFLLYEIEVSQVVKFFSPHLGFCGCVFRSPQVRFEIHTFSFFSSSFFHNIVGYVFFPQEKVDSQYAHGLQELEFIREHSDTEAARLCVDQWLKMPGKNRKLSLSDGFQVLHYRVEHVKNVLSLQVPWA